MKQLFPKILSHVAAWLAFLAIPFFLTPPPPGDHPPTPPHEAPDFIRTLFIVSLNLALIGFFYLNYFVLISKLWTRERRWAYFASVLGCFILLKLMLSVAGACVSMALSAGTDAESLTCASTGVAAAILSTASKVITFFIIMSFTFKTKT